VPSYFRHKNIKYIKNSHNSITSQINYHVKIVNSLSLEKLILLRNKKPNNKSSEFKTK
jgi:hypothetical protein